MDELWEELGLENTLSVEELGIILEEEVAKGRVESKTIEGKRYYTIVRRIGFRRG